MAGTALFASMRALGSLLCATGAWAARVVDVAIDGDTMRTDKSVPLGSWAITEYDYWDPTLQRYQARTVVLPKFEGDGPMALASRAYTHAQEACVAIPEDARDGCHIFLVQRLVALVQRAAPGTVVVDDAPVTSPRGTERRPAPPPQCALDFAVAAKFEPPVRLGLARPAQLPLLSVSNCTVPTSLRLCFSVFDATNMKVSWTMCEDAAAAAQEKYRIKPDEPIPGDAFTFTCDAQCSGLVFATDGLSGSAISARQFPTGPRGVVAFMPARVRFSTGRAR